MVTNIGIHFFDMLMWIFGAVKLQEVHCANEQKIGRIPGTGKGQGSDGSLSVDRNDLPASAHAAGKTTHRSITIDREEIEFSDGFTDLHTMVYDNILNGKGHGIEDARPSINLVYALRNTVPSLSDHGRIHPLIKPPDTATLANCGPWFRKTAAPAISSELALITHGPTCLRVRIDGTTTENNPDTGKNLWKNNWKRVSGFFSAGKFDDAKQCFRAFLDRYPENPEALNNLGVVCHDP